ncbi:MAG: tRNA-modifying protein YgfZ [Candidatus Moanabacter tarae]|uniref:tRNA-modifying protein YgfZ n=1 Tax=Candidatus Moanibacter tarae TaxID=2200854 RepID=A0A2Z4AEW2_9BACT|nr:MAG: tRNA-modifying protein YgfZ [Candidatus Moanabacter tarae]|tara:strand:- start:15628 stop:16572 length:945 start_codon:yes stop_codon:yes gene_type:complete
MSGTVFYKNHPSTCIVVEGGDSFQFLQSQFSNNLKGTGPGLVTYGLWLDRRGKVAADSFVFCQDSNRFIIHSYFCSPSSIIEKLEENIIADDVTLTDQSGLFTSFSCWGLEDTEWLAALGLNEPNPEAFNEREGSIIWVSRRSRSKSLDFLVPEESISELEGKVDEYLAQTGGHWASENELHTERIVSGIPWIPIEIGPNEFPQEGSLESDSVSFTKGCYLGQEVMARIFSRGAVKRGLYRVFSENWRDKLDMPCRLFLGGIDVGELRSMIPSEGGYLGHALLRISAVDSKVSLSLGPGDNSVVKVVDRIGLIE